MLMCVCQGYLRLTEVKHKKKNDFWEQKGFENVCVRPYAWEEAKSNKKKGQKMTNVASCYLTHLLLSIDRPDVIGEWSRPQCH